MTVHERSEGREAWCLCDVLFDSEVNPLVREASRSRNEVPKGYFLIFLTNYLMDGNTQHCERNMQRSVPRNAAQDA
jgi:hypothetical protein